MFTSIGFFSQAHRADAASIVAALGLSLQEQSLVAAYELDNVWLAPVGDLLRREPKDLAFQ
jgi:hypothetical protein